VIVSHLSHVWAAMPATRRGASSPALAAQGAKVAQSPSTVATVSKAAATNNASLSAYEEARLKNIARNTEVLAGLGIATETSAIAVAATKQRTFAKPEKRARESLEPVRRSTRGKDADGNKIATPQPVAYEPVEQHVAPTGPIEIRAEGSEQLNAFADRLQKLASSSSANAGSAPNKEINYAKLTLGQECTCDFARRAPR